MLKQYSPAKILVVRGISLEELYANEQDTRSSVVHADFTPYYAEIPKKFTGVDTWPKSTNLLCWECGIVPSSYPKFVPLNPEKDEHGEDICDVAGNFCEWTCVHREIMNQYPPEQRSDLLALVDIFRMKWPGEHPGKLFPGPRKTTMQAYCGRNGFTVEQWQSKVREARACYSLSSYRIKNLSYDS